MRSGGYPSPSTPYVTAIMRANRGRNTGPELRLRRLLHAAGHRYRVNYPIRLDERGPILVDIAFPRVGLAVLVDGCFWHSCPLHGSRPKANAEYWTAKLARNMERDSETTTRLGLAGWVVARFWEHEPPSDLAPRISLMLEELTRIMDDKEAASAERRVWP